MADTDLFGNPINQTVDYDEYMQSAAWQKKRHQVLARANNKCEHCGKTRRIAVLDVHHKTYARLGNELLSDLEALCRDCHNIADTYREWQDRFAAKADAVKVVQRIEAETGRNGFDNWACATLGEDWQEQYSISEAIRLYSRSRNQYSETPLTANAFRDTLETVNRVQPDC